MYMLKDYRGVSVLCATYKVSTTVLNERLKNDDPNTQTGFCMNGSTIDNVYIIQHIVQREMEKKLRKVYSFFIYLRSVFDKVSGRDLWKRM